MSYEHEVFSGRSKLIFAKSSASQPAAPSSSYVHDLDLVLHN
jgi:hypothetical protein